MNAVETAATWMQIVAVLTAAADSGDDERRRRAWPALPGSRRPDRRVEARAQPPVDADGDPSVATTVYSRRAFTHEGSVHHPTQTAAVHRQGTGAPKHGARMAGSVTPPTGED